MIPYLYKSWYYRLVTGSLAGLFTLLLDEVFLNLRYRYFELFQYPVNYLYAAAFGVALHETIYRLILMLDKRYPWQKGPGKRWLIQLFTGIFAAVVWIILVRLSISLILNPEKLLILWDEMMVLAIVIVLLLVINLMDYGYFLNERYRLSLAEVEKFRKENAEYQFEMLKLQLNPHFLFNSLNTLSSLVYDDSKKASDFIRRLSEVYRYVLENRNKELVSLREEMEFIKAFAYLQGIRFQGMISFNFDINEEALARKIAPMTLQLLVENAVKHNVASMKQPLSISISTDDNSLTVVNNLQPKPEQTGTGIGLKNIVSRYGFLSKKAVKIIKDEGSFKVIIPLM